MVSERQSYALKHILKKRPRWELSASDLGDRFGLFSSVENLAQRMAKSAGVPAISLELPVI